MINRRGKGLFIFACVAPAVLLFVIFMIIPTFDVFRMSLYKWGGYSSNKEFVGFNNFRVLFEDPNFYRSFQNTVLLIVVVTIITIVIALLFAYILSREKVKGKGFFRVIFYIPNILSIVVISAIFSQIYDVKYGLINGTIKVLTNNPDFGIQFLGNQSIIIFSIAGALIWQAIGYYMVMYMASMASIPESLYEAASLEGLGKGKQFFTITLPLIWNNIRTTLTFFIISTINLSFLLVHALTSGGPDGSSEVFLSFMYKQAYTNSTYGYGMAIGVVVFLFSFALAGIVNYATKRDVIER